jgi:glutaredoxin 3
MIMGVATSSIKVYTTRLCSYCATAKKLLEKKGVSYSEIHVDQDQDRMAEMIQRSQQRSVPQIFINNVHVGGFDELSALERKSRLDPLLGISGAD